MQIYGRVVIVLFLLYAAGSLAATEISVNENKWTTAVKLDGEWDFYWEHMGPVEAAGEGAVYTIPSAWTSESKEGQSFPSFGYGTYQTTVKLNGKHPEELHISTRRIKLAHSVYINGQLLYSLGQVGRSRETTTHHMVPVISPPINVPDNKTLKISIVVANYVYVRGGIDSSVELGTKAVFEKRRSSFLISSAFISGSLLIMALYHIGLWLRRKKDHSALSFGLFCVAIGIRMLVTNEKILALTFPAISTEVMLLIELATVYLGMPMLHFFVYSLFPSLSNKKLLYVSGIATFLFATVFLTGNLYWASRLLVPFEIYVLLMLLYVLLVGILALIKKEEGAGLFLVGLVLIMGTAIRDVLIERGMVNGLYTLHWGVLAFVFAQSALLSTRFANAYNLMEQLKNNLEHLVQERTRELKIAHDRAIEVGDQNRRLSTKMTTLLETERRDIAKEIHDNFSSRMVAARMHVTSIIKEVAKLPSAYADIKDSAEKIRENLNESYTDARALVSRLRPEIIDTLGLSKALSELANNYSSEELDIKYISDSNCSKNFKADEKMALYRIAQEAITNAIKHSKASVIVVKLSGGDNPIISISDNGVGFDTSRNVGNGISHMRERAMSVNGSLEINSNSYGTVIAINLN